MIGYKLCRTELEARVQVVSPTWLTRARERIEQFRVAGKYEKSNSIWSEVKVVYMDLQGGSKCAFCERKLEGMRYGRAEQAVEHFRPKANVKAWKLPAALANEGVSTANPPKGQGGYYLLVYDIFNYAASCHPCNSALKRDYFPVAGNHELKGTSPETLTVEQPLLIYPIGDFDDAPENLIHFHGVSPQATAISGYARHRALVTVEFFQLDSPTRKNLIREPAMVIIGLFHSLEIVSSKANEKDMEIANQIVNGFTNPNSPHTNCALSFKRLFDRNRVEAQNIFRAAAAYVESTS